MNGKNFISYEPAIGPIDAEPFLQYPPLTDNYKFTWGLSNGMVLIGSSVVVKAEPDAERWIFNGRGT